MRRYIQAYLLMASVYALSGCSAERDFSLTARSADSFVDSIGVNVHLGYSDTVYHRYDQIVKPRLLELGVRHIRDGVQPDRKDVLRKLEDLAAAGIHADLIVRADNAVLVCKEALKSVELVEGINEPDGRRDWQPDWVSRVRSEQEALYTNIKGDTATAKLPVLVSGMANTRNSPGRLGEASPFLDYGNMHSYPGGLNPLSGGWGITLAHALEEEHKVCGGKPIIVTETGYHNRTGQQGHPGVPEDVAAKYLPRLFLHYFNAGIQRVYSYELIDLKADNGMTDMEKHFGLLRNSGEPKPAFLALKKLIAILSDPGPALEPSAKLRFTVTPAPPSLEATVLQKRDGRFFLLLWKEELSYDPATRTAVDVVPTPVTVKFETTFKSVTLASLGENAEQKVFESAATFPVTLTDSVTLIELKP